MGSLLSVSLSYSYASILSAPAAAVAGAVDSSYSSQVWASPRPCAWPSALDLPDFPPPQPEEVDALRDLPTQTQSHECLTPARRTKVDLDTSKCGYLSRSVDEQLSHVLQQVRSKWPDIGGLNAPPLSWTIIDKHYAPIAYEYAAHLLNVDLPAIIFVNVDSSRKVAEELCMQGLYTLDYSVDFTSSRLDAAGVPWTTKLRVAKAKFLMPGKLAAQRLANIFTEVDVYWLKNPLNKLHYVPPGGPPSGVVIGTHYNNPWEVNIGFWYVSPHAKGRIGDMFQVVWDVMEKYATTSNKDDPYTVFDQQILALVMRDATIPRGQGYKVLRQACEDKKKKRLEYCSEVEPRGRFTDIVVRLLDNVAISSFKTVTHDEDTVAVHILSQVPLTVAQQKVITARWSGAFRASPEYYEMQPTLSRYIAWDGLVPGPTRENGRCQFPQDKSIDCGFGIAFRMLLALALRIGRTFVLPKLLDASADCWGSEHLFDVVKFFASIEEAGLDLKSRESSFLSSAYLGAANMYPVARIWIHYHGWLAIQHIHQLGARATSYYFKADEGIFVVLSKALSLDVVATAKTILLRFPTGEVQPRDITDKLLGGHASCRGAGALLRASQALFCERSGRAPQVAAVHDLCRAAR
eukprot:TRINITY_DN30109_c0_g1_i1.p1 TRINITY_DN30109_c0_g1~~TRINITY_DN30109_c0_g1_i1.p1  ORF type:complete len:634 (+),score=83.78 TRINITY_DN30109_c0_g1_i1:141-2042(+)